MELSVIIPVYKTEEYLEECVGSILAKATQDVEVILVDDGSPDNCPRLCDAFMEADSRVKVVHKQNGGLSSARNAGLSIASGRYVTFVDSDDRIYSESIAEILRWIRTSEVDLCFLQADKIYPDGTKVDLGENISGEQLRMRPREVAIQHLTSRPKYPGSAWAKLYRRDFLLQNGLHFPYDRRYSEDLGFILDCVMRAELFDAINVPYYQYRQKRQGSITNTVSFQNFHDLSLFISESVQKLTANHKPLNSSSRHIMGFVAYEYFILLHLFNFIPEDGRRKAFSILKEYRWTLRYATSKKLKLLAALCDVIGLRLTALLLKQYRKVVTQ